MGPRLMSRGNSACPTPSGVRTPAQSCERGERTAASGTQGVRADAANRCCCNPLRNASGLRGSRCTSPLARRLGMRIVKERHRLSVTQPALRDSFINSCRRIKMSTGNRDRTHSHIEAEPRGHCVPRRGLGTRASVPAEVLRLQLPEVLRRQLLEVWRLQLRPCPRTPSRSSSRTPKSYDFSYQKSGDFSYSNSYECGYERVTYRVVKTGYVSSSPVRTRARSRAWISSTRR